MRSYQNVGISLTIALALGGLAVAAARGTGNGKNSSSNILVVYDYQRFAAKKILMAVINEKSVVSGRPVVSIKTVTQLARK